MFNYDTIRANKRRYASNITNSNFYKFVYADLIDRLTPIEKNYQTILELGYSGESVLKNLKNEFATAKVIFAEPAHLPKLQKKAFDLIYFPFGLHWVGEVQRFLKEIRATLKEEGIFICNLAGQGSLVELRKILILAEEATGRPHLPHISPFIRFDDMAPLLRQAGFIEQIIDYEHITLEYKSPISLMKALKSLGESNAINPRVSYSITKPMYRFLQNYGNNFFEQVNLITLICSPTKNSIKLKTEYFSR